MVLGYDPKIDRPKRVFNLIHPDDLFRVKEGFQAMLEKPGQAITLQFRYQHKDGSWRHLESIGQNRLTDPEINAVVVNSRDTTDRWRAAEDLRASEKTIPPALSGQSKPDVGVRP